MFRIVALISAIAMATANIELDALENTGRSILSSIHPEIGGEQGGVSSLYQSISGNNLVKTYADGADNAKLSEGIGRAGLTIVMVSTAKSQVRVSSLFGVGAGVVANVRNASRSAKLGDIDEPTDKEVEPIVQPLIKQFAQDVADREVKDNQTKIVLGHDGGAAFNLTLPKDNIVARVRGGFLAAALVEVERKELA